MNPKQQLRKAIRTIKASYSREELEALSLSLLREVERHPEFVSARTLLLYHSLPDEVFTHDFIERWARKKNIILPTVSGDDLTLYRYTDSSCLHLGAFGILEPCGTPFTDYSAIDLAIVPGMAFDRQGHRLGRGKGYYDRLLPRLTKAYKLGLCYPFQLLSTQIPCEPHDQQMDEVIGELPA